jgi:hypothetical protein
MIAPKQEDIGRLVIYTGNRGWGGPIEEGVITSFNDAAVFVIYRGKLHPQATSHADLEWSVNGPNDE